MAEDYLYKRQALAYESISLAKNILDGIIRLNEIKREVAQSGGGFEDSDFEPPISSSPVSPLPPTSLVHLNAWKMNNLVNDVAPHLAEDLQATLEGSQVTYEEILWAVKKNG